MRQHGRIDGLIDRALQNNDNNIESISKVAEIALRSIEDSEADRPTMQQVVDGLERAIEIETNGSTRVSGTHSIDVISNMPGSNSASAGETPDGTVDQPSQVPT
jgi:ArsR family metal-binding transcriptional regulator